jgi:hypothetical protein
MNNDPIADVWPMMEADKLQELADDIKKNGELVPVWLYEGMILDGRNRSVRPAKLLALHRISQTVHRRYEPTAFAVSMNDKRRHMTAGVRAAVAVELLPFFEADAAKKKKGNRGANQRKNKKNLR